MDEPSYESPPTSPAHTPPSDEATATYEPVQPAAQAPPFAVNIYPVIYWALLFGAVAGLLLFLLSVLARFITIVWLPVFLTGMAWGAYRNYQKQRQTWAATTGAALTTRSAGEEMKEAARDIYAAAANLTAEEPVLENEEPTAEYPEEPPTTESRQ